MTMPLVPPQIHLSTHKRWLVGRPHLRTALYVLAFMSLHMYLKWVQPPDAAGPQGSPMTSRYVFESHHAMGYGMPNEPSRAHPPGLTAMAKKHRVTVISFFETWCGPCKVELPALEKLYREHEGEGLGVVGVYGPSSDADLTPFISKLGLTFPLIRDTAGAMAGAYGIDAVPTSVLVDADMQVLSRSRGFSSNLSAEILEVLAKAKAP